MIRVGGSGFLPTIMGHLIARMLNYGLLYMGFGWAGIWASEMFGSRLILPWLFSLSNKGCP